MKRPVVAVVAAVTVAASLIGAAAPAARPVVSGRNVPHVFVKRAGAAPTTADCQAAFGISCYAPFQLQKAYDLQPLYAAGLDGRGKTIVIVDSFGSPTIEQDLAQFDAH